MTYKKIENNYAKTTLTRMRSASLLIGFSISTLLSSCFSSSPISILKSTPTLKSIYYVDSKLGSNSSQGSQTQPWKTIQKCLDRVQPGDTCQILSGTYYEALILKTSGLSTAPITIKCDVEKDCTVNSSISQTVVTGGRVHFYIIDGLRFIADYSPSSQLDVSLDFTKDIWDGETSKDGGNNGFIVRNCYIEGALIFYGHNNLVENCELNGKNKWINGITERMATSHDNVYRNNIVHDYIMRGFWSNQATDNVSIEGNTIYNLGSGGIDCDGAYVAVTRCNVRNNNIYNATKGEGVGVLLENAMESVVEGNTIHDVVRGISAINYNKDNGDDPFQSSADYKELITNTTIRNNLIYNASQDGILCKAVSGNKAINNTLYNIKASPGYWGAIGMSQYDGYFCHNWEIKNNIVSQITKAVWYESPTTNLTNFVTDYNFYDLGLNEEKFSRVIRDPETFHNYTFNQWKETMGLDVNSLIGDPLFVNTATGDFHLQPNSPACTGGENGTYIGAFPC